MLRVIRTLQEVQHEQLLGRTCQAGGYKVIFVQDQISVTDTISIAGQFAGIHRAFGRNENVSS